MIKICPAILVSNKDEFLKQLEVYKEFFDCIDIDINIPGDDFEGEVTVGPLEALLCIGKNIETHFNIHLMVSNPKAVIEKFLEKECFPKNYRILIHQESKFKDALDSYPDLDIGIVLKAESDMREIEFYNQFPEVQLMTIVTGKQGNPFIPEILYRVEWLREEGYKGTISIDGSVNLKSASFIRMFEVNRVSVGSFFSKTDQLELNLQKLTLALNM